MKVLIVGLGSVGKKHYQVLRQIDPEIKLVAWRNNEKADLIENVNSVFSVNEIYKLAPYDFAIISNPTNRHFETIKALLSLKCPLFIEKPLFDTLYDDSLLDTIYNKGIKTYVACNLRFLDSILYIKENLLPKLRVNEVNIYCGSYLPEWRKVPDYKAVYSAHSDQGGGAHLDLIHEIDYSFWLFGRPLNVNSYRSRRSSIEIDSIDYANYLLEYHNFALNIILNYYRRDKKRTIELVCSDDTYTADLLSNSIFSTKGKVYSSEQSINDTYMKQMKYFIDKIKAPQASNIMNDIKESYEVLKICLTNDTKR